MPHRLLHFVRVMNAVSVCLFVLCCLHTLSHHSNADTGGGALTIVQQDEDNEGVTVEVNGEGDQTAGTEELEDGNGEPFYPTHTWQTVKKGQTIPAGLHVRMNLQTGEREAKLMDDQSGLKFWKTGDTDTGMTMNRKQQLSKEQLKKALKDFKTTKLDETNLQREAEVKAKFRSYEELKADFESINMDIKTDGEIVQDLLKVLKDEDITSDKLLVTLKDLEYYLHQIDNAVLFKDVGGLPYLIKTMNSSVNEEIQIEAVLALGAAMSSNPQVQVGAVEVGALQVLLRLLSTHTSINLRRKVVFAISTLCRHFPFAQKNFLDLGGLSALQRVFREQGTEKIQVKAVSFLNDLMVEKDDVLHHTNMDKEAEAEKYRQYKLVTLRETMSEQGWCELVPTLLRVQEHDNREQILRTMKTLASTCRKQFSKTRAVLTTLGEEYKVLSAEEQKEDDDLYFTHIHTLVNELKSMVTAKDEL